MSTSEGIKLKQTLWKSEAKKAFEICAVFDHSGGSKIIEIRKKKYRIWIKSFFFYSLKQSTKKCDF